MIVNSRYDDYLKDRKRIIEEELTSSFGMNLELNAREQQANQIIMDAKEAEYQSGLDNPFLFTPSRHIFEVLDTINQTKLFKIIKQMPKGGLLHAHNMAFASDDFIVRLTYWDNLWQQSPINTTDVIRFKFSLQQPVSDADGDQTRWLLVKDVRVDVGPSKYDAYVRSLSTLNDKTVHPKLLYRDINDVWDHFANIFVRIGSLIQFVPAFRAYFKNALEIMRDDGVQYLEFRGVLTKVFMQFLNFELQSAHCQKLHFSNFSIRL